MAEDWRELAEDVRLDKCGLSAAGVPFQACRSCSRRDKGTNGSSQSITWALLEPKS